MKLSKRLELIASFVKKGSKIADIGTDHGYIPIYLVKEGVIDSALAMDIRKGPLERAKEHIRQYGLEERIEVRLSDGLEKLRPKEADTVIIAGMGGELILHILENGKHLWDRTEHFILSPQSDLASVRHYLERNGFCIVKEEMLKEDGKYYTVMDVQKGQMKYEKECEYHYGKCLIKANHPVLQEWLEKEKQTLLEISKSLETQESDGAKKRLAEILKELAEIKEAEDEMQRNH